MSNDSWDFRWDRCYIKEPSLGSDGYYEAKGDVLMLKDKAKTREDSQRQRLSTFTYMMMIGAVHLMVTAQLAPDVGNSVPEKEQAILDCLFFGPHSPQLSAEQSCNIFNSQLVGKHNQLNHNWNQSVEHDSSRDHMLETEAGTVGIEDRMLANAQQQVKRRKEHRKSTNDSPFYPGMP
jgi:hypothetical protein